MPPITPGGIDSVINQMNQNIAQQNTDAITKIVKDETGTRRVLSGKGKDGFYGFKVSQPGFDVFEAGDDELVFNSGQNVFKIVGSGTATLNGNATSGVPIVVTVAHNLGFVPIPMVFGAFAGESVYIPLPHFSGLAVNGLYVGFNCWSWASVDDTNLYLNFFSATTNNWGTQSFKYYLLQETAV